MKADIKLRNACRAWAANMAGCYKTHPEWRTKLYSRDEWLESNMECAVDTPQIMEALANLMAEEFERECEVQKVTFPAKDGE